MINIDLFGGFYKGKRVLVTGHTGFKGSWLTLWLTELGAEVTGMALDPEYANSLFVLCGLHETLGDKDIRLDIRDRETLKEIFKVAQPEIVFHLAAQPLVRLSYEKPVETYETNVMGTINVLEAIRATESVRVGVMITTDKCYENREQIWGYRENEPMGGYDPYSSSKGAAEIAISSWRRSFFSGVDSAQIASVRAGNVIGGGDWAADRIVPDIFRAVAKGEKVKVRSPHSIRPWQHVLEPLNGYMTLAKRMWEEPGRYDEAWNFGPEAEGIADVWTVASKLVGEDNLKDVSDPNALHEAKLLMLDINKARMLLGWKPVWSLDRCLAAVSGWYLQGVRSDVKEFTLGQIAKYVKDGTDCNRL